MKKILSQLLALAMLLLLCACGPVSKGTSTTAAMKSGLCYDGSQVTITFAHDFNTKKQQILDKYIAQFQARYPNITVAHHSVGDVDDAYEQMLTLKSTGNYANVVICQPDHVQSYIDWDIIVSLDDMVGSTARQAWADGTEDIFGLSDAQKTDFVAAFYEDGMHGGALYTLPLTRYANVLYYNQDFFATNDLPVPSTWEEMEEVCRQIRQLDPESTPLLVQTDEWLYYELCARNGLDISKPEELFGGDIPKRILTCLDQWEENQYLDVDAEHILTIRDSFAGEGYNPRCYMVIDHSSSGGYYYSDFKVGIALVPQADADQNEMLTEGLDLCVLKKDNLQEVMASWLFVEFLSSNADFQAELSMYGGYIPVTNAVRQNSAFAAYISAADGQENLSAQSAKFCMESGSYYQLPAFACKEEVYNGIHNLLYQCMYTEADDLQTKIQNELQKLYDQYVK